MRKRVTGRHRKNADPLRAEFFWGTPFGPHHLGHTLESEHEASEK